MDWEFFGDEGSNTLKVLNIFSWPVNATLVLSFLIYVFWPRRHSRSPQEVPKTQHSNNLSQSLFVKRVISKSREDINKKLSTQLIAQLSTLPTSDSFEKDMNLKRLKSSPYEDNDIHFQFDKLVKRMNKSDDLKNVVTDFNVIDYRGKETLDHLTRNMRQIKKKKIIWKDFHSSIKPTHSKSLMTFLNQQSVLHKPMIKSLYFSKSETFFENIYNRNEEGTFENCINQLKRVQSFAMEEKNQNNIIFSLHPNLFINKNEIVHKFVDLNEKSTMTDTFNFYNKETLTNINSLNNTIYFQRKYNQNQKIIKKTKKKNVIKNEKNISRDSKNIYINSKLKNCPTLYYLHYHPISYANLLRGPHKANISQIIKEIFHYHKKNVNYIKYEFDRKRELLEKQIEKLVLYKKNNVPLKKENLKKHLIRIKENKESFLFKELNKLKRLHDQIKKCYKLTLKDSQKFKNHLDNIQMNTNETLCLLNSKENLKNSELYKIVWNDLLKLLKQIKLSIKNKGINYIRRKNILEMNKGDINKKTSKISSEKITNPDGFNLREITAQMDLCLKEKSQTDITTTSSGDYLENDNNTCISNTNTFSIDQSTNSEDQLLTIKSKKNLKLNEESFLENSKIEEKNIPDTSNISNNIVCDSNENSSSTVLSINSGDQLLSVKSKKNLKFNEEKFLKNTKIDENIIPDASSLKYCKLSKDYLDYINLYLDRLNSNRINKSNTKLEKNLSNKEIGMSPKPFKKIYFDFKEENRNLSPKKKSLEDLSTSPRNMEALRIKNNKNKTINTYIRSQTCPFHSSNKKTIHESEYGPKHQKRPKSYPYQSPELQSLENNKTHLNNLKKLHNVKSRMNDHSYSKTNKNLKRKITSKSTNSKSKNQDKELSNYDQNRLNEEIKNNPKGNKLMNQQSSKNQSALKLLDEISNIMNNQQKTAQNSKYSLKQSQDLKSLIIKKSSLEIKNKIDSKELIPKQKYILPRWKI